MSTEVVTIVTERTQVEAHTAPAQDRKTQVVGRTIRVEGAEKGGPGVDLYIQIVKPKPGRSYDTARAQAKRIHAWMLWNLPSSTYRALVQLLEETQE